jgi:hypothetical protein
MLVLITGVGNMGKSHFRRLLLLQVRSWAKESGRKVVHYDVDRFAEARHELDKEMLDALPKPGEFDKETIYLIEDVHAPTNEGAIPLCNYDYVFYVVAGSVSHLRFWIGRARHWLKDGKYDWDPVLGEHKGTGKPYDLHNVLGITRCVARHMTHRRHIVNDLIVLRRLCKRIYVTRSSFSKKGPVFRPIPLEFLSKCL